VRIGSGAADGTNVSQWRRVGYQMVFFPLVLCWVCGWCILRLRVPKNNEVELSVFPRTSHIMLLRMGGLTFTVMVHGRVLCLETL